MHTICLLEYDITYQSSNLHIFTDKYLKWLENTVAYIYTQEISTDFTE